MCRLVYIRGSATQNAAALQIIINKVGGRPFDEEVNPSEPLIKIEETNCVISIPTSAATFIVTGQSFGELPHPDRVYTMGGVYFSHLPSAISSRSLTLHRL